MFDSERAEQQAKRVLIDLGFSLEEEQVVLDDLSGNLQLDILAGKEDQTYVVEVKSASNLNSFLNTTFYRAIAQVRAAEKRRDWRPLVVLILQDAVGEKIRKVKERFDLYAPDVDWICVGPEEHQVYSSLQCTENLDEQLREEGGVTETAVSQKKPEEEQSSTPSLRFSDLELWMFKVLYFSRYPPEKGWNKEGDLIENGNQLSNRAEVSLPTVYNWFQALEEEGYLKRIKRKTLQFRKLGGYLQLWSGRYRFRDNRSRMHLQFVKRTENPFQNLVSRIKELSDEEKSRYVLTGHAGARQYGVSVTPAKHLQFFRFSDHLERLRADLDLIPAESGEQGTVVSYRPRFEEAVYRGIQKLDQVPVVDPLQLYLDCYYLKERGREQAEAIKQELLSGFPE